MSHLELVAGCWATRIRYIEGMRRPLIGKKLLIASIGVAFVNAEWAKYCWLLLIPFGFISRRNPKP